MNSAPSPAWDDLRTAATVVVMRAEQVRNGRPMPPEIAALERALEELGADGVKEPAKTLLESHLNYTQAHLPGGTTPTEAERRRAFNEGRTLGVPLPEAKSNKPVTGD